MFCKKCGSEQSSDALFCANCGTAVRTGENSVGAAPAAPAQAQSPVPDKPPKKKGKALVAVVALLLVVGLAVGAAATKGFGLIKGQSKSENPVAVVYDAAKKILMSTGFDARGTMDLDGDIYTIKNASLLLGRGLKSSVASFTLSEDWHSNKMIVTVEGLASFYDEEPDWYDSFYLDEIEEDFQVDADRLVQDGRIVAFDGKGGWDSENIVRQLDGLRRFISQWAGDYDFLFDFSAVTTVRLLAEALEVVDGFFYDYCDDKAVWEDIIVGYTNEGQGSSAVSTFGVDLNALLRALVDYLPGAVKNRPTLNNFLEQYIEWEWGRGSGTPTFEAVAADIAEDIAWDLDGFRITDAILTTDKQGRLEALTATCYAYGDRVRLEANISNYNAPSLNPEEAARQIEQCKNRR